MNEKIYEYKDDSNWFIGRWTTYTAVDHFVTLTKTRVQKQAEQLASLIPSPNKGFVVQILKQQSDDLLFQFILSLINQELGRQFELKKHHGATLITEHDHIYHLLLPEDGLPLSSFLEQSSGFGDTILIATRNEGKTSEFRSLFKKLGYAVENLNAYPDLPDIAETGTTFEENARLKAETIAELTGRLVLADDSGLKVDVLGGLPGVWSARFSGEDATDASNNQKLLHELAMVFESKDRSAQFHATLVLAKSGKESLVVSADWPGYIAFDAKGENGFGYDPLFLVGETGRRSAELSLEEKNQISHRALAAKKLLEGFAAWQKQ